MIPNPDVPEAAPSPGQQLAAARQSQGWSVAQVAAQLKLAPRQIEAIEADRLDELPGMVVARGFVRTYARLLKIDSTLLLAAVAADTESPIESLRRQRPLSAPFSETTRLPSMHPRRTVAPSWVAGGVLALLVLAAGVWGLQQANGLPPSWLAAFGQQSRTQDAVVTAEVSADVAEEPEGVAPSPGSADPVAKANPIQLVDVKVDAPHTAAVAVASATTAAAKTDQLSLVLRQDSWIEITRADRSILVSRLARAGTVETFDIVEPVLLVVGNAAGVEATLRNVPLDLKSGTSTNVARINLK